MTAHDLLAGHDCGVLAAKGSASMGWWKAHRPAVCLLEGVFEVLAARSEHDKLAVLLHHPVEAVSDQVHAFLVVQPADEAQ